MLYAYGINAVHTFPTLLAGVDYCTTSSVSIAFIDI